MLSLVVIILWNFLVHIEQSDFINDLSSFVYVYVYAPVYIAFNLRALLAESNAL